MLLQTHWPSAKAGGDMPTIARIYLLELRKRVLKVPHKFKAQSKNMHMPLKHVSYLRR